jgi:hypothetical protein
MPLRADPEGRSGTPVRRAVPLEPASPCGSPHAPRQRAILADGHAERSRTGPPANPIGLRDMAGAAAEPLDLQSPAVRRIYTAAREF